METMRRVAPRARSFMAGESMNLVAKEVSWEEKAWVSCWRVGPPKPGTTREATCGGWAGGGGV